MWNILFEIKALFSFIFVAVGFCVVLSQTQGWYMLGKCSTINLHPYPEALSRIRNGVFYASKTLP